MLRSIPSKLGGVVVLLLSIAILLVFPIFFNYKSDFMKYDFNIKNIQPTYNLTGGLIYSGRLSLININLFINHLFYYYKIKVFNFFYNYYNIIKSILEKNTYTKLALSYVELYFHYFKNSFSIYPYMFSTFIVT
jgi:hypothetical protein